MERATDVQTTEFISSCVVKSCMHCREVLNLLFGLDILSAIHSIKPNHLYFV